MNSLIQANDGSFVMAGFSSGQTLTDTWSFIVKTRPEVATSSSPSTQAPFASFAFEPITINADGSVIPSNAPIIRNGNEYELTADINNPLIIKADNIVINGQDHLLSGNGTVGNLFVIESQKGIDLSDVKNDEIENVEVQNFKVGFSVDNSNKITIFQNSFASNNQGVVSLNSANSEYTQNSFNGPNEGGIQLTRCLNDKVINNQFVASEIDVDNSSGIIVSSNSFASNIFNNGNGVLVSDSSNTLICDNTFYKTFFSTSISSSSKTIVAGNGFTECHLAIIDSGTPDNLFYMNNFIKTEYPPSISMGLTDSAGNLEYMKDLWDNGIVGNYWDNYTQQYPNSSQNPATQTWNTAYVLDANNTDHHPLISPVTLQAASELAQTLISKHVPSTASSLSSLSPGNVGLSPIIVAFLIITVIIGFLIVIAIIRHRKH